MQNRIQLAEHFQNLGFKIGAEIGTFDGYYAEMLCEKIPGLNLFVVDPWEVYDGYRDHKFVSSMQMAEAKTRERLQKYQCTILKEFSKTAIEWIPDEYLDFVFIDANHAYPYVKEDIELWTPKVRTGGIVSGHDYYITKKGNVGVINAVDEYVKKHGYTLQTTEWDNENPIIDNRQPCWYFTK